MARIVATFLKLSPRPLKFFIRKVFVHGKPAKVSTTALNTLFAVEHETLAVEKLPGRKTDVRGDVQRTRRPQRRLDALIETAGNSAPGKRRLREEKVQIAVEGIRGETCK